MDPTKSTIPENRELPHPESLTHEEPQCCGEHWGIFTDGKCCTCGSSQFYPAVLPPETFPLIESSDAPDVLTQWQFDLGEELCEQVVVKVSIRRHSRLVTMFFAPYAQEILRTESGTRLVNRARWDCAMRQARQLGRDVKRSCSLTLIIPWREEFNRISSSPLPIV